MANKFFSIVSHNAGNLSSVVSYTTTESYTMYCIPEKSSTLYPTTPQVFFRYPTMEDIFLHYEIQWKRFSFVVGYNGRSFPPLWDTTDEVFFHFGILRKKFFSVAGCNGKKMMQGRIIFLNFKCLSLPSNKNFGKICY